jgi:hypothetical protein
VSRSIHASAALPSRQFHDRVQGAGFHVSRSDRAVTFPRQPPQQSEHCLEASARTLGLNNRSAGDESDAICLQLKSAARASPRGEPRRWQSSDALRNAQWTAREVSIVSYQIITCLLLGGIVGPGKASRTGPLLRLAPARRRLASAFHVSPRGLSGMQSLRIQSLNYSPLPELGR